MSDVKHALCGEQPCYECIVSYMLNNDLEIQVIEGDADTVGRALKSDGMDANQYDIKVAIAKAKRDPYIKTMMGVK